MKMKPEEKEVLLEQLRYKFRREVKLELIRETQELEEENHLIPGVITSQLDRHKRKLEISFAVILGFLLGVTSVPVTFVIMNLIE